MPEEYKFEKDLEDFTDPDFGLDSAFRDSVDRLLEDIKWQIDRESSHPPLYGPMHSLSGTTHQHNHTKLFNGRYNTPGDVPQSDYLTRDFSAEAQYDKLTDISQRFVQAVLDLRQPEQSRLIWGSSPALHLTRHLHGDGLLLLLMTKCCWL